MGKDLTNVFISFFRNVDGLSLSYFVRGNIPKSYCIINTCFRGLTTYTNRFHKSFPLVIDLVAVEESDIDFFVTFKG